MTVRTWVSQYTVTAVPEDWPDPEEIAEWFEVTVQQDAPGMWAVRRGRRFLGAEGAWSQGPSTGQLHGEWWNAHHFTRETALRLAEQAAPDVKVNGTRAGDL